MVPVQLAALVVDEQSLAQQVRLGEVGGSREVAIMIGMFEALAIQRALGEARSERPLTHKLLLDVIQALGASLERVEVEGVERDPQGDTFFAKLVLRQGEQELRVDSRPSDAIAAAVRAGVPLYVTEKVMSALS